MKIDEDNNGKNNNEGIKENKDFRQIIPHTMSRFSESHMTAPYTNIEYLKPYSKVSVPPLDDVIAAKEWVEENKK